MTENEILTIEPNLEKKFVGGYYTKTDSTGDIHKFTSHLARVAMDRGVNFQQNADVKSIKVLGS